LAELLYYECYLSAKKLVIIPIYENISRNYNRDDYNARIAYFELKRNNNTLSTNSIRKLIYALNTLKDLSTTQTAYNFQTGKQFNFLLNFITLTLPAINKQYSDLWIKRHILNNFLNKVKYKYNLSHYVWKAEAQGNGNLHFHITTNTYIHFADLNRIWNNCLEHTDLIDHYKKKFNNRNPNTTDIHSIKQINSIHQEFIKYISKNETDRRKISGKLWDCSKSLNFSNRLHFALSPELFDSYEYIQKKFKDQLFSTDYFDCYSFRDNYTFRKLPKKFIEKYDQHLQYINTI